MRKEGSIHPSTMKFCAAEAEKLIRAAGDHAHIAVRAYGQHLIVESHDEHGAEPIARLTRLAGLRFGLSFRNHTGRWEPMPFEGDVEKVTGDLIETLGPYLARVEFSPGISGKGH